MVEARLAARKSPNVNGNSNGITNNHTQSVLPSTGRIRRRHHIAAKAIRRQRRMYILVVICVLLFCLAFFHLLRNNSNAGSTDDDYTKFMRQKKMGEGSSRHQIDTNFLTLSNPKQRHFPDGHNQDGRLANHARTKPDSRMPNTDKEKEDLILERKVQLISINISKRKLHDPAGYEGAVEGHFCFLDWEPYMKDPSAYPMFRDLVYHQCGFSNTFSYDIHKIVKLAETYDTDVRAIEPTAFVFHESRCGSTLVANALIAMSPTEHLVYSEAQPPLHALKACGIDGKQCIPYRAEELFQDVVYIMGRTNEPGRNKLFFKIQSMATKYIPVAMAAFPNTPWVFVYRDPVQILMSQFKMGIRAAICVRQLIDVPKEGIAVLKSMGKRINNLNPFEKCAFHLNTLCEAAIKAIDNSNGVGIGVNYEDLTNKLINTIFPDHFKLAVTEENRERIIEVSGHYSKGRGKQKGEWKEDSEQKDESATPKIKEAAKVFMHQSYHTLENDNVN